VDEAAMLGMIDEIPRYYDEPFADSSQIPTMAVCRLARQNVTVAISGDGGDELFCGYDRYQGLQRLQRMAPILPLLAVLGRPWAEKAYWRNWRLGAVLGSRTPDEYVDFECVLERYLAGLVPGAPSPEPIVTSAQTRRWEERRMLLDLVTYLPGDILAKVDRASMAFSLEVRCPLLDHRVVEAALALPHAYKFRRGIRKFILKEILYKHVPASFFDRPKRGFSVPLVRWLSSALRERVEALTSEAYLRQQGIFDPVRVGELRRRFYQGRNNGKLEHLAWSLLMFQMWHEAYMR
jgi:asparagine synthase (glutamine-hydrolysing)